jgi:hypothetical protein
VAGFFVRGRIGGMRFSLAQLFWLTFWLGALITIWQMIVLVDYRDKLDNHIELMFIASSTMLAVAAYGAMRGRPKMGAVISFLVYLLVVACITWLSAASARK